MRNRLHWIKNTLIFDDGSQLKDAFVEVFEIQEVE